MAPTVTCLEVDRASMAHPGGDVAAHASPDTATRRVTAGSSPLLSSRAMSFASRTAATVASAIAARSSVAVATSTVAGRHSGCLGAGVVGVAAARPPGSASAIDGAGISRSGATTGRGRRTGSPDAAVALDDRWPRLADLVDGEDLFAAPLNLLNRADAFMSVSTSSSRRVAMERRARGF